MTRELYVVALLHPAATLRGRWSSEPDQVQFLKWARDLAAGAPWDGALNVDEPPPGTLMDPTPADLRAYLEDPLCREGIACDIEAVGDFMIAIGFCRIADEKCAITLLRRAGGEPAHPIVVLGLLMSAVYDAFADPRIPWVFHNGLCFDVPYLNRFGFEIANFYDDTILMVHAVQPELGKRLGRLGVVHGRLPAWKHLVREDEESAEEK